MLWMLSGTLWVIWFALTAFVLMKLWNWFVVPLGVMRLSFWHAAGIFVLAHLVLSSGIFINTTPGADVTAADVFQQYYARLWGTLAALGFGFIAKGNLGRS